MKSLRSAAALLLAFSASLASAGEIKQYTPEEFEKLTKAGSAVVIDISAPWCPTCKAQKPIVDSLMQKPAYRDVTLLTVDFDSDKATLKKFKVTSQSTLIAFKGVAERDRSVGDTSASGLEKLVAQSVK